MCDIIVMKNKNDDNQTLTKVSKCTSTGKYPIPKAAEEQKLDGDVKKQATRKKPTVWASD